MGNISSFCPNTCQAGRLFGWGSLTVTSATVTSVVIPIVVALGALCAAVALASTGIGAGGAIAIVLAIGLVGLGAFAVGCHATKFSGEKTYKAFQEMRGQNASLAKEEISPLKKGLYITAGILLIAGTISLIALGVLGFLLTSVVVAILAFPFPALIVPFFGIPAAFGVAAMGCYILALKCFNQV